MVTHKMDAPRGIVQDDSVYRVGTILMTEPYPNEFEVTLNDKLSFTWVSPPDPYPQKNDVVQVIVYGPTDAMLVKVIK